MRAGISPRVHLFTDKRNPWKGRSVRTRAQSALVLLSAVVVVASVIVAPVIVARSCAARSPVGLPVWRRRVRGFGGRSGAHVDGYRYGSPVSPRAGRGIGRDHRPFWLAARDRHGRRGEQRVPEVRLGLLGGLAHDVGNGAQLRTGPDGDAYRRDRLDGGTGGRLLFENLSLRHVVARSLP